METALIPFIETVVLGVILLFSGYYYGNKHTNAQWQKLIQEMHDAGIVSKFAFIQYKRDKALKEKGNK